MAVPCCFTTLEGVVGSTGLAESRISRELTSKSNYFQQVSAVPCPLRSCMILGGLSLSKCLGLGESLSAFRAL
ncbi:Hypothetical protein NTJ_03165 [Nesidiocoris tenuis]|uniref:Uncharacterized protein n=1 Tax=Nesidiocoris tenuis TaxID=355587 RepID=A0ABN7ADI7_9HEMI|nr:Hypothetical protein NTJ_03165 [Nesidiocoris tenuis]